MNCPICSFMSGPNAASCGMCGYMFARQIIHWKSKTGTLDIDVSKFYEDQYKIHEPYEHLVGNAFINPDYPIMDIQRRLDDEAVSAYCKYLAHPECCVRVLIARMYNEEILQAVEANHSITTLHIYPPLSEDEIRRVIKNKDLYTLSVGGSIFQLTPSPNGVIPTQVPYSELTIRNGSSSYRDIEPESFLETASQLSSLKFFVADTNPAMIQSMFNRFGASTKLTKLSIGIGGDPASAAVFWSAATEFVCKSVSIRKFTVRCDGPYHDSVRLLVKEVTRNTRITHFSLTCVKIDEYLCDDIAALIKTNTHLKRIKIYPSQMFECQASIIAEALKENTGLKRISLCGMGDSYNYLEALLVNTSITSFKTDDWNGLVKHCTLVAKILNRNILRSISMPMRWSVDEADLCAAVVSCTSLRRFHMNVALHPSFAQKKFLSVQFASFDLAQLNQAIELINLSPPWLCELKFGFSEPVMVTAACDFLADKLKARVGLQRYWAVIILQTLQLFTARDMGLLAAIPPEVRLLIARMTTPSYVINDKQFDLIVTYSTRGKLQQLVKMHKEQDLYAYEEFVEDFLYNLLVLE